MLGALLLFLSESIKKIKILSKQTNRTIFTHPFLYKWGVGWERFGDTSLCWKWIPIAQFWTSEKPMLVMVAVAAKAYGCSCGVPFK
jgi:hypothetical protein